LGWRHAVRAGVMRCAPLIFMKLWHIVRMAKAQTWFSSFFEEACVSRA
jgi:hypothetical protein